MGDVNWTCRIGGGGRIVFAAESLGSRVREMVASTTVEPIAIYSYFSPSAVEHDPLVRDLLDKHDIEVELWANRTFMISSAALAKLRMVLS